MEELIVIQGQDYRTRSRAARDALSAYQTAAWRAPGASRFDSRPANDFLARADAVAPQQTPTQPIEIAPMPRWVPVFIGMVVAALLGGVLGGVMSL